MTIGCAQIAGTWRNPYLELTVPPYLPHPTKPHLRMVDWVKSLPGRRWDAAGSKWIITGLGPHPDQQLREAGIEILPGAGADFAAVTSLRDLSAPVSMLASNRRTVLIRHRLAGYDEAVKLAGPATTWDKTRGLLRMPVADVLIAGQVRPGIHWTEEILARAYQVHQATPAVPGLELIAAQLGSAPNATDVAQQIATAANTLGHLPSWFGVQLFGYQKPGVLAVAAGHTALIDAPGVGKTVQFLAAAAVLQSERTLIICPPIVLTNWAREVERSQLATGEQIVIIRAGRKEPSITGARVVIIADSLLAARPATAQNIIEWAPTVIGYDEAHRAKTIGSKRSEAILDLVAQIPGTRTIALTGTPILAGPHELVPLLDFTGHLAPVFGGPAAFLNRYCRQDKFGGWHPRKEHLPELNRKLSEHVTVRRTKDQVLPDLPAKQLIPVPLDLDITAYRQAHTAIIDTVTNWVRRFQAENCRPPSSDDIADYARESIRFVSHLRAAAGLAKISAAAELIRDHVNASTQTNSDGSTFCTRPLVVWTHHTVVTDAMAAGLPDIPGGTGVIMGGTSDSEKNRLVDQFQAGLLPVLVCSITTAGVGITLTRSSDIIFVETDWTPALITQAIDRCHRIGQSNPIQARFLIALGTLDEHIQRILESKGVTSTAILGDTSGEVAVLDNIDDLETPQTILEKLILDVLDAETAPRKRGQTKT